MKLDFREIIQESAKIKLSMLEQCLVDIESAAKMMLDAIRNGKKYFGVEMVDLLQMLSIWRLN